MTDNDYIRKAVELADGFMLNGNLIGGSFMFDVGGSIEIPTIEDNQWLLDALAAQLVRQMDELILYSVHIKPIGAFIDHEGTGERITDCYLTGGRTMNTIKAIVDSKVLDVD